MVVNQPNWTRILVTGRDRVRFLQGMCTQDVQSLVSGSGEWRRACILNVKARVLSVVEITAHADSLELVCPSGLGEKTVTILRKHALMDQVAFASENCDLHREWTQPQDVWSAPPQSGLRESAATHAEIEAFRIAAVFPEYGVDVDEDAFPFESPLASTINYEKGCYIGQEPVFRVHAKGQPSRMLCCLRGAGPAVAKATPVYRAGRAVGQVTSSAQTQWGALALAYIHRDALADEQTQLRIGDIEYVRVTEPLRV